MANQRMQLKHRILSPWTAFTLLLSIFSFTVADDCEIRPQNLENDFQECLLTVGDGFFANRNKAQRCTNRYARACVGVEDSILVTARARVSTGFVRGACVSSSCPEGSCESNSGPCTGRKEVARKLFGFFLDDTTVVDCCASDRTANSECSCGDASTKPESFLCTWFAIFCPRGS